MRASFPVGKYTCTITLHLAATRPGVRSQTNVQWEPDLPQPGALTADDLNQYIAGRNALHQRIADIIGGTILVADL